MMADPAPGSTTWTSRAISMVGLVLVGALSLTACGSDDTAGASGTSASKSSTAAESTSVGPGDGASADPTSSASRQGGSANRGAGASGGQGGSAASADDAAQITRLTTGLNGHTTMADYMQYNLDHSCSSYIERSGGRTVFQSQIDDMRKENQTLSEAGAEYNVAEVTDIKVNGDNATATVSGTLSDQQRSEMVSYLRESGAWTICPAA